MQRHQARPDRVNSKAAIAGRIRLVRTEKYGKYGIPVLAEALRIPTGSWANYERGVTIPGDILLEFLVLTEITPTWLLHGVGDRHVMQIP